MEGNKVVVKAGNLEKKKIDVKEEEQKEEMGIISRNVH